MLTLQSKAQGLGAYAKAYALPQPATRRRSRSAGPPGCWLAFGDHRRRRKTWRCLDIATAPKPEALWGPGRRESIRLRDVHLKDRHMNCFSERLDLVERARLLDPPNGVQTVIGEESTSLLAVRNRDVHRLSRCDALLNAGKPRHEDEIQQNERLSHRSRKSFQGMFTAKKITCQVNGLPCMRIGASHCRTRSKPQNRPTDLKDRQN